MKPNVISKCVLIDVLLSLIAAYIVLDVPFPTKESTRISENFEKIIKGSEGVIIHDKEEENRIDTYIKNNKDKAIVFYPEVTYKTWFFYYFVRFIVILIVLLITSCVYLYLNKLRKKHA